MPKRPVKQMLNRFSSPVLRQHAIATLLHQLRSGKSVSDKQMESVLLPEDFYRYSVEAEYLRNATAIAREMTPPRPEWISEYIKWMRKGNLVYGRDNYKGEAFFERAAEIISENYQEGQTELWFDRPVRGLFDVNASPEDQVDAHGWPVAISPGSMPRVVNPTGSSRGTVKGLKERVLQEAFDSIENRTLSSVRAALAAQNDDDDMEPK